jgi:hypothetical protein
MVLVCFCICETVVGWCADMLVDPGIGGRSLRRRQMKFE